MIHFNVEKIIRNQNYLKLAHHYCETQCVQSILMDKTDNGYQIVADVKVHNKTVRCSIKIADKKMTYHCECVYCGDEGPCPHIGAVMMKINQLYIKKFPYTYDVKSEARSTVRKIPSEKRVRDTKFDVSRKFIQETKRNYLAEINIIAKEKKVSILPVLEYEDHSLYLQFRIVSKLYDYLIKKIPKFIDDVKHQRNVRYSQWLEFVHTENVFDDLAKKQIHFMEAMVELMNARSDVFNWNEVTKTIPINGLNIDEFFNLFYQTDVIKKVNLKESQEAFPIVIKDEKTHYLVSCRDDSYVGNEAIYCVRQNEKIIEISKYQFQHDKRVLAFVKEISHGKFIVAKRDLSDFIKYALSPIQDYLLIDSDVNLEINEYPYIKIYGDVDSDALRAVFKINYEDDNYKRVKAFQPKFITNYKQDLVEKYMRLHADEVDEANGCVFFRITGKKWNAFLHEGLQELNQYCNIYLSESIKKLDKPVKYSFDIGVHVKNDLLSLDIHSSDIPANEISSVLSQYRKHDKYYRLKDGKLLHLNSVELEELSQLLDKYQLDTTDIHDGEIALMKNRIFSVDEDAEMFRSLQFKKSQTYERTLEQFSHRKEKYELSPYYDELLRPYQHEGYQWLRTLYDYGFNGILADDMGLGKTLQVICLLDELQLEKPSLIICPASILYNWETEIRKFALELSVQCITGTSSQRKKAIEQFEDFQINVTSYDYLRTDYKMYENKALGYLILDEAQYIKNPRTRNAIVVKQLKAEHRLALSGTPIENNLSELWSIFDFLMPHYLYSYYYFRSRFETKIVNLHDENKIQELQKMVSPFMLRRNKKDVLTELPEKIENTQLIEFDGEEKQIYDAHLSQAYQRVQELFKSGQVDKISVFALLTQLRQICNDPRLVYQDIDYISSKMRACIELLQDYKENNQKVLVFSSLSSVFELIADELKLNGISYLILTGDTSKEKRQTYVDMFQKGEVDVFLVSLKAGGTGLNLTRAEAVIHYDPWWNMAAQDQATDRAYRIGQEHNLNVHKLVMKDSIEERILKLQESKQELSELFVESSTGNITTLTKEEILELFK